MTPTGSPIIKNRFPFGVGDEWKHMEGATFDHLRNGRPVCRNGARTSMNEAKRLKAAGYKRGFPDVFVYEPRGTFHGLAIELKKEKEEE